MEGCGEFPGDVANQDWFQVRGLLLESCEMLCPKLVECMDNARAQIPPSKSGVVNAGKNFAQIIAAFYDGDVEVSNDVDISIKFDKLEKRLQDFKFQGNRIFFQRDLENIETLHYTCTHARSSSDIDQVINSMFILAQDLSCMVAIESVATSSVPSQHTTTKESAFAPEILTMFDKFHVGEQHRNILEQVGHVTIQDYDGITQADLEADGLGRAVANRIIARGIPWAKCIQIRQFPIQDPSSEPSKEVSTRIARKPVVGHADGFGTYTYEDGRSYVGGWKNYKRHGMGTSVWPDGDLHVGEYEYDKMHGKGKFTSTEGNHYEGCFKADKMDGLGTFSFASGSSYVGEYKDGLRNGIGTFKWNNGSKYRGQWKADKREGKGVFEWTDGRRYEGGYKDNTKHGHGLHIWPDGRKYDGEWAEDKKNGFGTFYWPDGDKYVGQYQNDKMHGRGVFTSTSGNRYTGEFRADKMDGTGEFVFASGSHYVGQYKQDQKHGKGRFVWKDGSEYEGIFRNDKRHGLGTFKSAIGRVKTGLWENGEFKGEFLI